MSPKTDAVLPPSLPREEPTTPVPGRPDTYVTVPAPVYRSGEMRAVMGSDRPPTREAWEKALRAELDAVKQEVRQVSSNDHSQDAATAELRADLEKLRKELPSQVKHDSRTRTLAVIATVVASVVTQQVLDRLYPVPVKPSQVVAP
jgi:K+-sensing histidine kinase KdpD